MMKSPEEEADQELAKRLQQKFQGFNAPVNDRVRVNVFAALSKSPKMAYWLLRAGMLLLAALIIGYIVYDHKPSDKVVLKGRIEASVKIRPTKSGTESISEISLKKSKDKLTRQTGINKKAYRQTTGKEKPLSLSKQTVLKRPRAIYKEDPMSNGKFKQYSFDGIENSDIKINRNNGAVTITEKFLSLALLPSIDSFNLNTSFTKLTIAHRSADDSREIVKREGIFNGFTGVFSLSVLQTFQLIDLSETTSEHVQNFRFAPFLSSRSLTYKLTAGVEKKHTRLSLSYAYLRNWNEYEIGTNQVVATKIGENQYRMIRVGEKHIEDDRSHLIGMGIQQKFMMPQHILKGYSVNTGAEYTRLMPSGQNLVWGNFGFYKQIYKSSGTDLEVGPYAQYSFTQREIAGQTWKSRPYQVGVSLHIKMK